MNKQDQKRIEQLLKKSLPPIDVGTEPSRDLWPAMLKRLASRPSAVPWFDWALLAAVAVCLMFFPEAIPVLFYHL